MLRSPVFLAAAAAAFAVAWPSTASAAASEVEINGMNQLFLSAAPGEDNDVDITMSGANLILNDTVGVSAGPGSGCMQINPLRASCPLAAFETAFVLADDGSNTVDASTDHRVYIEGLAADTNNFESTGGGDSTLVGGLGPDYLRSTGGNDLLGGVSGPDRLIGGSGNDGFTGGSGNDTIEPGAGADDIRGEADIDTVDYSSRFTSLDLSLDNVNNDGAPGEGDNIHDDTERVVSGQGADDITGSPDRDLIEGRNGPDTIDGGGGSDDVFGENGNDVVQGGAGIDFVSGGDDQDDVDGGSERDLVVGSGGNDVVKGSLGDDQVSGGPGADQVLAGGGDDEVQGDAGPDNLVGGQGADELSGGADNDTVDYSANAAPVNVDLDGSTYDDGVESEGDTVATDVENATGGSGPDKLTGNGGQNVLTGAQGDDTIDGGANNDTLIGASGSDTLRSNDGVLDVVDCGTEIDTFDSDPVDTLIDCEPPAMQPTGGDGQPPADPPADPPVDPPAVPASAKLVIGPASARLSRSRVAKLSVRCPASGGGACTGTLRLQRTLKGKVRTLGKKGFNVPAGAKRTVKIKVSKSTAKTIARRPLRVNAVSRATVGASDTSRKVTLKKPAARGKR